MAVFPEEVCFNAAIGACGGAGEIELLSTLRNEELQTVMHNMGLDIVANTISRAP